MLKKLFILQLTLLIGISLQAQICSLPNARAELNIGNVRAGLLNGGDFWWNGIFPGTEAKYEFPKVDTSLGQTPIHAIFAGGLWLSTRDNNNNLKVAAMTFRNYGLDFYPGPIDNNTGTTTFSNCNFFNRFWEIYASEIDIHLNNVYLGLPVPISLIPNNILMWPAKGNVNITAYSINQDLAPFVDYNGNGIYDPEYGDYPETIGDQTFFWVINDIGGPHTRSDGDPLKVEVQFLAHAFESPSSPLYNSTVYEIKTVNKSFGNLSDLRVGLFVDPDLGFATDDYVGCDTTRDAGFVYNSIATDYLYGNNPPVISFQFLNQEMESFAFLTNAGAWNQQDPNSAIEFDNSLHGLFLDGNDFSYNNNLPSQNGFQYPGNPDLNNPYSMANSSFVTGSDFRTTQSTGIPSFPAWSSFELSFAINASVIPAFQPDSFYYQVEEDLDNVLMEYNALKAVSPVTGIKTTTALSEQISIYPNPTNDIFEISIGDVEISAIELISVEGKVLRNLNNFGNSTTIDISNLPSGIYFVKVKTKDGSGVQKVLKK